jgi:membrane protein
MHLSSYQLRRPFFTPFRLVWHTWTHCLSHHTFTRASALTYTTLLAIVPTLILIHSIAGAFGILDLANNVLPLLNRELQLGLPVAELKPILGHAESIGFGQLGIIGSLGLLITFVMAFENLETNLNVVWHVKENRSLIKKFLLSVPFLGLLGAGVGGIAAILSYLQKWLRLLSTDGISVLHSNYWHWVGSWGLFLSFHAMTWVCLYLLYQLVPFARVERKTAMISALVALVSMRLLVWVFLHLQAYFFERMSLFYGSLAFIPLVMLFVYGLWCVILFGNALSWRQQHWPPNKSTDHLQDEL